jgi:hypothetical protein
MADWWQVDDTEFEAWKVQAGEVVHLHQSLNEDRIMAENAAIRSNELTRNLSFGRPILRMSLAQLEALQRRFPVLRHGSALERTRMWKRIARDPEFRRLWV